MKLEKLLNEIRKLKRNYTNKEYKSLRSYRFYRGKLQGIKQVVDVVNSELWGSDVPPKNIKIWREIKELLKCQ